MATGIQWAAGFVLFALVIALLISPFAVVWVLGGAVAILVAIAVWTYRVARQSARDGDADSSPRSEAGVQTGAQPAERPQ